MYDFVTFVRDKKELKWPNMDKSAKKIENVELDIFYHESKILINFMRLLGAMPVSKNKNGRFECKLTSPTSIYSILLYVIFSVGGALTIRIHIRILNNFHIDFDDKITIYASMVFLGFHFLPLIAFCEGRKMAQFYSSFKDFESRYFKITKQKLLFKMRKYQYLFLLLLFVVSIFFLYFTITVLTYEKEIYKFDTTDSELVLMVIIYQYYLWVIFAFVANWMLLTFTIRTTARILLKDIKDVRLRSFAFEDLYGLWLDLKNITEDCGITFSWTYLFFLSYMFLVVMGTSYSLFASMANPDTDTRFGYLGLFVVSACMFAVMGDCAHRTTVEVGEEFNNSLLKLLSSERDPIMRREMKWFIQTMALNPPIITLSGFVTLNRGFNVSMLGTLVTYIVVVLQFRSTSYQQMPYLSTTTAPSTSAVSGT